jgi:hypothetical protein
MTSGSKVIQTDERLLAEIRRAVQDVLSTTDLAEPERIAAQAIASVSPDNYADVLEYLLAYWIKFNFHPIAPPSVTGAAVPAMPFGGSAKVTAIRNAHAWLRRRVIIDEGQYVMLGNCSVEQVDHLARLRRTRAAAVLKEAIWFEQLATALRLHAVARPSDLPTEVLDQLTDGVES